MSGKEWESYGGNLAPVFLDYFIVPLDHCGLDGFLKISRHSAVWGFVVVKGPLDSPASSSMNASALSPRHPEASNTNGMKRVSCPGGRKALYLLIFLASSIRAAAHSTSVLDDCSFI